MGCSSSRRYASILLSAGGLEEKLRVRSAVRTGQPSVGLEALVSVRSVSGAEKSHAAVG